MPLLYKELSRLASDAKKMRKFIREETGIHIKAQDALDCVASFFLWNTWNEMYVACNSASDEHTFWHDMRWREKHEHIGKAEGRVIKRLAAPEFGLTETKVKTVADWLFKRLAPRPEFFKKQPSSLFSLLGLGHSKRYEHITPTAFREGMEIVAPDTLALCEHLGTECLPQLQHPGCVVFCDRLSVMDFVRMFESHHYAVSVVGNDIRLPATTQANVRPVYFHLDETRAGSVDDFLRHALSRNTDSARKPLLEKLIDLMILMRTSDETSQRLPELPDLSELLTIYRTSTNSKIKALARSIALAIFHDRSDIEAVTSEKITTSHLEQWAYLTMNISSHVALARDLFLSRGVESKPFQWGERPQRQEAVIIVIPSEGSPHRDFLSAMSEFMLSAFSTNMAGHAEDDIFVFAPNTIAGMSVTHSEELELNFSAFNRARANPVLYGDMDRTNSVDFLVELNDDGASFCRHRLFDDTIKFKQHFGY